MRKIDFLIRTEEITDYEQVFFVIQSAFLDHPKSNHKEQHLVELLRKEKTYKPYFSVVAETIGSKPTICGHILMTEVHLKVDTTLAENDKNKPKSLAIAPLTVSPGFQGQGVGKALIEEAHKRALSCGYELLLLVGNPNYYQKFGYIACSKLGISLPYDVPSEFALAKEIQPFPKENNVKYTVNYPKVFQTYVLE